MEDQADFPRADSQAGAEDRLFVNKRLPGRVEQVWGPQWVQSVG